MATFFIDYERLILQAYEQKKRNNTLPHGLKHLTPAKLKNECIMRCRGNLNRRDEKVIRDFCGDLNETKTYLAIIQQCDTDKFKPLVNFLKRKTESTDPKNIELLAWLIDFPNRPWETGKTYSGEVGKNPGTTDNGPDPDTGAPEPDLSAKGSGKPAASDDLNRKENMSANTAETGKQEKLKGNSTKRLAAAVIMSAALGAGVTWLWKEKKQLPDGGGCMYWKEDHYEPVACNRKMPNTMIIALDSAKLKNFKKITAPDTITYMALGKVWYSKIDGKIEYYTAAGVHPVALGHRLKPITIYIIDKYLHPDMSSK